MNTLQAEKLRDIVDIIYVKTGVFPETKIFEDLMSYVRIVLEIHIKKE